MYKHIIINFLKLEEEEVVMGEEDEDGKREAEEEFGEEQKRTALKLCAMLPGVCSGGHCRWLF